MASINNNISWDPLELSQSCADITEHQHINVAVATISKQALGKGQPEAEVLQLSLALRRGMKPINEIQTEELVLDPYLPDPLSFQKAPGQTVEDLPLPCDRYAKRRLSPSKLRSEFQQLSSKARGS